jgi:hypothetical protein
MKTPNLRCLVCKEAYNRHFESILGFTTGYISRRYQLTIYKGAKPKRTHSFHEHEKYPIRELCAEEMALKYRVKQAHKELFV